MWPHLLDDAVAEALASHEVSDDGVVADEDRIAQALAGVIHAKSPYTADRSSGVARHAVAIAQALGVSNRILDKPGRLTDEEYAARLDGRGITAASAATSSPPSCAPSRWPTSTRR